MPEPPVSSAAEVSVVQPATSVRQAIESQPVVKLLRGHRAWRVLAMLAAAGVMVIALLGGFRSATPSTTGAARAPGVPLKLGAYSITALSAVVGTRMPGQVATLNANKRVLSVTIQAVNNTDRGTYMGPNLMSSLMLLDNARTRETKPDDLVWADTGSRDIVLPPHLPVRLVAVWELPAGASVPPHVEVGAYKVVQGISRISLALEWARGPRGGYWRLPVVAQ